MTNYLLQNVNRLHYAVLRSVLIRCAYHGSPVQTTPVSAASGDHIVGNCSMAHYEV